MGKHRKRKNKAPAAANEKPAGPELAPIVKKLHAEDVNDRAWAATAISHLIQDMDSKTALMNTNVVASLVGNIKVENHKVVLETLGALRNTLLSVGQDACIQAIELGAQNMLLELFGQFVTQIQQGYVQQDDESPNVLLMLEQTIACLWNLVEYSDKVVKQTTTPQMIEILVNIFCNSSSALSLRKISGQFLNTLTDDNPDIYPIVGNQPVYSQQLVAVLQDQTLKTWEECKFELVVISSAILNNIRLVFNENDQFDMFQNILLVLSQLLDYDMQSIIEPVFTSGLEMQNKLQNAAQNEQAIKIGDLDLFNPKSKESDYIQLVNSQLSVLQLALEVIANMFSEEGAEWEDQSTDEQDEDTSMEQDPSQNVDELLLKTAPLLFQTTSPIFPKIVSKCTIQLAANTTPTLLEFNSQFENVQIRAMAVLANLFILGLVSVENQDMKLLWTSLFEKLQNTVQLSPVPLELFESILSLLFAISKSLGSTVLLVPTPQQVSFLLQTCSQQLGAPENIKVKIVGILSLLARMQGHVDLNKMIGQWIMDELITLSNTQGPAHSDILAELLNSIYDIYGDKMYDYDAPVYVHLQFNKTLIQQLPLISAKFKSIDKKANRDIYEQCREALVNLKGFIKYKQDELGA